MRWKGIIDDRLVSQLLSEFQPVTTDEIAKLLLKSQAKRLCASVSLDLKALYRSVIIIILIMANIGKRKPQQTIDRECASVNYTESASAEAQFHSSLVLSSQQSQTVNNCTHLRYAFTDVHVCIVRMHSTSLNLLLETMFDMPDDARCRKFADYVVDDLVAADSDFPPTLWAHAPDAMPVILLPMELNPTMDV